MLTSQGPGAFAAAMTADSDTPELVWTYRMRTQRLVPQVCVCSAQKEARRRPGQAVLSQVGAGLLQS